MTVPLIGGAGQAQKIDIREAVQALMQQMGSVMAGIEQLTNANNTMAMDLELIKKRTDALEAKATLIPDKIEVIIKQQQPSLAELQMQGMQK
jgi:regulator of replication initiation timing